MNNKKFFKTLFVVILLVIFVFIFDMLTKYILIGSLIPNVGDSVDFIDGFINFVHVQNYGAGWGIFQNQVVFLVIISILILAVIIWFYIVKIKDNQSNYIVLLSVAIGFIAGGCIGNLYDRIAFGYVRDFINFQFISFPVFNIADVALCIGVGLFVLYIILDYIKFKKKQNFKQKDN